LAHIEGISDAHLKRDCFRAQNPGGRPP